MAATNTSAVESLLTRVVALEQDKTEKSELMAQLGNAFQAMEKDIKILEQEKRHIQSRVDHLQDKLETQKSFISEQNKAIRELRRDVHVSNAPSHLLNSPFTNISVKAEPAADTSYHSVASLGNATTSYADANTSANDDAEPSEEIRDTVMVELGSDSDDADGDSPPSIYYRSRQDPHSSVRALGLDRALITEIENLVRKSARFTFSGNDAGKCLYMRVNQYGRPTWAKPEYGGSEMACRRCTNAGRPCLRIEGPDGYRLAPLIQELRVGRVTTNTYWVRDVSGRGGYVDKKYWE